MSSRTFDVSIDHREGSTLVVCKGELDVQTSPRLAEAFDLCFERTTAELQIDCGDLSFVDSSGVRVLLSAARRCTEKGIPFAISASEQLRKVADVLGIGGLLGIGNGAEEADNGWPPERGPC